jgi:hypothetical protein
MIKTDLLYMKHKLAPYFILLILLFAGCSGRNHKGGKVSDRQSADTGKAVISFTEYEHNFGKVKEGEKVGCIFSFRNTGTADLVINSATTSCGCTVPKYASKPIAPGNSGSLEVVFNTAGRGGIQSKTITVKSNASIPVVMLKITAEIITNNNK